MKAKPRPVWVLTTEYAPHILGGLGTTATNLSQATANRGQVVIVISHSPKGVLTEDRDARLRVIGFPTTNRFYDRKNHSYKAIAVAQWLRLSRVEEPGAIHVHSLAFGSLACHYRNHLRIPLVYTCHSLVAHEQPAAKETTRQRQQEDLLRAADYVTVPSQWLKSELVRRYRFCSGKTVLIRHGVDRPRSNRPSGKPLTRLLFVGRIIPSKGIEELLRAVSLLARINKEVHLSAAGPAHRSYLSKLKQLSHRLGIASRVQWLGFQGARQLDALYSSHGAVIMPSRQESFGLVALEALANGIPLVSTRAGGLAEFVTPQVAAIIPTVSARSIADAILGMWNAPKRTNLKVQHGLAVASRYSWSAAAARYIELFRTQNG